ncbi:MAG: amino acid ABC transporter permease [Nocardioidaceae bacterium]|nr:amino acid ABC transporter permease [Nocardioidaceae bacterium]
MSSPGGPSTGKRERLALASAGVSFRLKVAVVWTLIFLFFGIFFYLAKFDNQWMLDNLEFIARGLQFTVYIAIGGIVLAIFLAGIGALGRISSNSIAFGISGFYVSFFRGTPLIVQLFLIYLALPQVGANLSDRFPSLPDGFQSALILDAAVAGILALGLNYGAYMTEIFRAGIQSINPGQSEAAEALGMTYGQRMGRVILPQAFRVIIPPTGNEFIAMLKDTALVSFVGVSVGQAEIFRRSQLLGRADNRPLEALIVAAGMYWALTALFTVFQSRLEKRLSKGYVRGVTITTRERPAVEPPPQAGLA